MARYTKDENGNLILTAGGTRTWIVTQAAHDRAVSAGTAPNNCLVAITDDYPTEEGDITDTVTITTSVITHGSISVWRMGNVVIVNALSLAVTTGNATNFVLGTGFPKPVKETYNTVTGSATKSLGQLHIRTNGTLDTGWGLASDTAWYCGELVYLTKE